MSEKDKFDEINETNNELTSELAETPETKKKQTPPKVPHTMPCIARHKRSTNKRSYSFCFFVMLALFSQKVRLIYRNH